MAKRRSRPRRSPLARLLRRLLIGSVLVTLLIALAVGGIVYYELARSLPPLDAVVDYQPPVATQILAEDGTVIGEFFSEKRYQVPIDRIPSQVREAFLAAEDDAFYRHRGVDLSSIIRAFINNLLAGEKVQGGSTITQQVVKSLLLTPRKSYERKLKEIILSLRLEQQLSKDEILGLYLNHIYLGSGAYGVAAAAREYFGKDITDINLSEAAVLAGLPRAPSRYSPYRHWPSAKARQRYVLNRMYQSRFITREERDAALRRPIALASRRGSFLAAPYFVEHVRRIIEERSGHTALYELGLRVHTTLNLPMQQAAEAVLREGLETLADRHGAYRSSFRRLDAAQREIYLSHQARALHNQSLDPTRTYEGIVTSVRVGSARVQVGPLVGNLVGDPSANGDLPDLELNDFVLVRVMDTVEGTPQFMLDPGPGGRRRTRRPRATDGIRESNGWRLRLPSQRVQPRHPGETPARFGVQAPGLRRSVRPAVHPRFDHCRLADLLRRPWTGLESTKLQRTSLWSDIVERGAHVLPQRRDRETGQPDRRRLSGKVSASLRSAGPADAQPIDFSRLR